MTYRRTAELLAAQETGAVILAMPVERVVEYKPDKRNHRAKPWTTDDGRRFSARECIAEFPWGGVL